MADVNRELADFLRRARSSVDPSRAGLPADGRVRRVPVLRREEVALLAGVSTVIVRMVGGAVMSEMTQEEALRTAESAGAA